MTPKDSSLRGVLAALLLLGLLQVGYTLIILPLMNAAYPSNLGEHAHDAEMAEKVYQLVRKYPPYSDGSGVFFGIAVTVLSGGALFKTWRRPRESD